MEQLLFEALGVVGLLEGISELLQQNSDPIPRWKVPKKSFSKINDQGHPTIIFGEICVPESQTRKTLLMINQNSLKFTLVLLYCYILTPKPD